MTARTTALLAGLMLLTAAPRAAGQTTVVTAPGAATQFTLEGVGGGDAFGPAAAAIDPLTGVVVPPTDAATVGLVSNFGFSYLRPYWAARGQQLRLPAGPNPAAAVAAPFGDLSRNFGFVPRLDLAYNLDNNVELGASVQYVGLGGSLDRTVALAGGSADLVATSNLAIVTVTPVEISKPFALESVTDHPLVYHLGREYDTFVASIGLRYVSIRQDFHASLRGEGGVTATSDATQTFNGFGLTAGLTSDHPLTERWGLYTMNRTTLLLGQNYRKSSSVGADASGPFSTTLSENKTTLFPVSELELGVRYRCPLKSRPTEDYTGPWGTLRVGFTGQYYSAVGFLPSTPGTARFDNRPLFLAGFTVLAGVEY